MSKNNHTETGISKADTSLIYPMLFTPLKSRQPPALWVYKKKERFCMLSPPFFYPTLIYDRYVFKG